MYSFNPNLYELVVDIRRSGGATEVGDAELSLLLAGKGKPPTVGVKAATIVSSGQVIDHELLSFGKAEQLGKDELFAIPLRFNGKLFTDNLDKRVRECERTQNTLRALIVAAKVHVRIVINGEQSSPLYLKLNHRLAPMC